MINSCRLPEKISSDMHIYEENKGLGVVCACMLQRWESYDRKGHIRLHDLVAALRGHAHPAGRQRHGGFLFGVKGTVEAAV